MNLTPSSVRLHEELAAERRRLVAETRAVRRQSMLALGVMSLVVGLGAVMAVLLFRAEQKVNELASLSASYSLTLQQVHTRSEIMLDPSYRSSVPLELVESIDLEFARLFAEEQELSTRINFLVHELDRSLNRRLAFVNNGSLREFQNSTVDPRLLEIARGVPTRLINSANGELSSEDIQLRSALTSHEFTFPAMHREVLVREIVGESREQVHQYSLYVLLATIVTLAIVWLGAFWPATSSLRDLISALNRHAAEIEHGYLQVTVAQRVARLGYWFKSGHSDKISYSPELAEMMSGVLDNKPGSLSELAAATGGGAADETLSTYEKLSVEPGVAEFIHTIERPGRTALTLREWVESIEMEDSVDMTGVFLDISELTTAQQVIHRMEKFEIVDLLISGIAHDFNNLLGIIAGNAELALNSPDDDKHRYLTSIQTASESAAALIVQLRQTAMDPSALAERFEPAAEVQRTVKALDTGSTRVELDIDHRVEGLMVEANPGVFNSCVVNLMKNAFEALGADQGLVEVSVKLARDETQTVINIAEGNDGGPDPISSLSDGALEGSVGMLYGRRRIVVTISDSGEGMSEQVLRRARQPFYTTKAASKGHAGLGLWSVYAFAKAWDGDLDLSSSEGVGTTVSLTLPVSVVGLSSERIASPHHPVKVHGPVLFVEDLGELREVLAGAMTRWGLDVVACGNLEQALDELESRDDLALVITDVRLGPTSSGFDLALAALERDEPLGVVLISGAIGAEEVPDELQVPMCMFLPKPFAVYELYAAVVEMLERSRLVEAEGRPDNGRGPEPV